MVWSSTVITLTARGSKRLSGSRAEDGLDVGRAGVVLHAVLGMPERALVVRLSNDRESKVPCTEGPGLGLGQRHGLGARDWGANALPASCAERTLAFVVSRLALRRGRLFSLTPAALLGEVADHVVLDPLADHVAPPVASREVGDENLRSKDLSLDQDRHQDGRRRVSNLVDHAGAPPVAMVVPKEGFEPTRPCGQRILSPPRLPFRHFGAACPARKRNGAEEGIRTPDPHLGKVMLYH